MMIENHDVYTLQNVSKRTFDSLDTSEATRICLSYSFTSSLRPISFQYDFFRDCDKNYSRCCNLTATTVQKLTRRTKQDTFGSPLYMHTHGS
eukprot:scaffold22577_cov122-Cylindrotheca_fusiformis.AAC.3